MHQLTGRWIIPFLLLLAQGFTMANASIEHLRAGPMLGYAEMREVAVWVQTTEAADVQLIYWPLGNDADLRESAVLRTAAEDAFTATLIASKVQPSTRYQYLISINGDPIALPYRLEFQTLPDWRGKKPPPDLKLVVTGANYVNEPPYEDLHKVIGEGYSAFEVINSLQPDAVLAIGTAQLREADWGSRTGYLERYSAARSHPAMAPLLASANHYGTWSVFDYGPPRASGSWIMRDQARDAFRRFWPTASDGVPGLDGITATFRWSDVEFFMLDVRSNRVNDAVFEYKREILGQAQLEWLKESLRTSPATFKVIVSGMPLLNPAESEQNFNYAEKEHQELLRFLEDEKITGVFAVSGGRTFSEMTKLVRGKGYPVYDLTVGPITTRPQPVEGELNYFREPGTRVNQRSFATLYFTGPEDARKLMVAVHNLNGDVIWKNTIPAGTWE